MRCGNRGRPVRLGGGAGRGGADVQARLLNVGSLRDEPQQTCAQLTPPPLSLPAPAW
jgi:hypothetical protein